MDISSRALDTWSIFQCDIIHIMLISLFAGYYSVGAEVTLAIISSSAVVDLGVLDLSYRTQRIENILRMIMGHATTQNLF